MTIRSIGACLIAMVISMNAHAVTLNSEHEAMIRLASRAPSGHNTQPWSIRPVSLDNWVISIREEATLPVADPSRREALISIGAFLENLIVAGKRYDYKVEYRTIAGSPADKDIVDIFLKRSELQSHDSDDIEKRMTIRKGLRPLPLMDGDLIYITSDSPKNFVYYPRGSDEADKIATIEAGAFKEQAWRDDAEEELSKWMRWSKKDAAEKKDGLTTSSMEITGIQGWFARNFFSPKTVMKKSFREKSIALTERLVNEGGGWMILTSHDSTPASLIETGRKLESFLLRTVSKNIGVHPMSQALEEPTARKELIGSLGLKEEPQMLLRIGYVNDYPRPVSPRKNIDNILIH